MEVLVSVAQAPTTVPSRAEVVSAAPSATADVVRRLDVDLLQRLIEAAVAAVQILRHRLAAIVGQRVERRRRSR